MKLNYIWHLKKEGDIHKIREWQANTLVNIIAKEVPFVIGQLQFEYAPLPNFIQVFQDDINVFDKLFTNDQIISEESLINELYKFSFLKGYNFTLLNNHNALKDFELFRNHDIQWNRITPSLKIKIDLNQNTLKNPLHHLESPILFYSIEQIIDWMRSILKGQPILKPYTYPNYKEIMEGILKLAQENTDKSIKVFMESMDKNLSKSEKTNLFLNELDKIRHNMNQLDDVEKQYFASIHRDQTEHIFTVNSLIFGVDEHSDALKKAAVVYFNYINFSSDTLNKSNSKKTLFDISTKLFDPNEIFHIAYSMVIDNDLQERLSNVYKDALENVLAYAFPIEFVFHSLKEEIHKIFLECIERFQEYLDDCEPGNKILYLQSRLKELKQRELKLNSFSKLNGEKSNYSYTTLFKEYLQLEADFIRETNNVQFIPNKALSKPKTTAIDNPTATFGCRLKDKDKLINLIKTLTHKIDFLKPDLTSAEQLTDVLTVKDLSKDVSPIYFGCETTQLRYVLDKLIPHFTKLTFKNMEDSKLFYTKKGTQLKAQNLSASKIDTPKDYLEIDKAFSHLL